MAQNGDDWDRRLTGVENMRFEKYNKWRENIVLAFYAGI